MNKFLNNYKKPGEVSDKPLIEANSGELLNILNSQDDAVWLLNNIVSNQNNDIIPLAQNGKVIKDNNGYWNSDNWGKVVEIDSNDIRLAIGGHKHTYAATFPLKENPASTMKPIIQVTAEIGRAHV